jgi:hypothetical protein
MIKFGTSAGWCPAGSGHGVPGDDERERAEWMFAQYPGTTVLRQFFSGTMPTAVPAARALGALLDWPYRTQCEVVLSHVGNPGVPIMPITEQLLAAGIPRVTHFGRHEPYEKVTPQQFEAEIVGMAAQVPADLLGTSVHVGPCWILYRDRIGNPTDRARFATPALLSAATMQAWDCYPSNPDDLGTAGGPANPKSYEPVDSFLDYVITTAGADGHPWAIGELNHKRVSDGPVLDPMGEQRARWFGELYAHAAARGALFVAQFHYNTASLFHPTGASGAKIEAAAWREICAGALYARRAYDLGVVNGDDGGQEDFEAGRRAGLGQALELLGPTVPVLATAVTATADAARELNAAVEAIASAAGQQP